MPSKLLGAPGTPRTRTRTRPDPKDVTKDCALRRADLPLNGGDAAILWAEYSRYPTEAGIAGRRYKQLASQYTDPWALLMAVAEAAFEGHHAAGACRGEYLRSRAARIRETVYAEQKQDMSAPRFTRGMRRPSFADPLAIFGRPPNG